ncbi:MAG: hypothetical protein KBG15_13685 [Kofleriaceae bacterium]|nr:hypothetical protein [Kofleriaceae bacterium]
MSGKLTKTLRHTLHYLVAGCSVWLTACAASTAPPGARHATPAAAVPLPTRKSTMFPTLAARTLANRAVTFPQETAGKVGLLFVAFERDAQEQINSWLAPLLAQYVTSDEVSYYEIPLIAGGYGMVAKFIDGGMRRGVPQALHDRTATYYGPRQPFFDALEITDTSKPYLFVLDKQGHIVFRVAGWYNGIDAQAANDAITDALGKPRATLPAVAPVTE